MHGLPFTAKPIGQRDFVFLPSTFMSKQLLSRKQIEGRIHDGQIIVIFEGKALKLNAWLPYHPGGDKAVYHLVGRDGTDEMNAYHGLETIQSMNKYSIGRVEMPWIDFVPPIQGGKFRSIEEIQADEGVSLSEEEIIDSPQDQFLQPTYGEVTMNCIKKYDDDLVQKDLKKYPSLDRATQDNIRQKYRELYAKLENEGYFKTNYWGYACEFSRISLLFILCRVFFVLARLDNTPTKLCLFFSAMFLGFAWHQIVFIVHDAAHLSITHNYHVDSIFSILLADFIGGLSAGWWKRNHNVHHVITNDPIHDPDIQHLPFFAVSTKYFGNVFSTFYERRIWYDSFAKKLVPIQKYTYHLILCFGRFNLYRLSWEYILKNQGPRKGKGAYLRYVELTGLIWFTYWFFYLLITCNLHTSGERWLYIMVSHIATMPVHVQITLSHFGMSTSDLGTQESFAQRQLRTTMDVDCPSWIDFFHGGLQFQVIHHLFPRMPRHNFRSVQPFVRKMSQDLGLHYTIYGFHAGNKDVLNKMQDISKQARILADCTRFCEKETIKTMWGNESGDTMKTK